MLQGIFGNALSTLFEKLVIITWHYCFVINAKFSCSVDAFSNFAPMLATHFVETRIIIRNIMPGEKLTKVWGCPEHKMKDKHRYFQSLYHLSKFGDLH